MKKTRRPRLTRQLHLPLPRSTLPRKTPATTSSSPSLRGEATKTRPRASRTQMPATTSSLARRAGLQAVPRRSARTTRRATMIGSRSATPECAFACGEFRIWELRVALNEAAGRFGTCSAMTIYEGARHGGVWNLAEVILTFCPSARETTYCCSARVFCIEGQEREASVGGAASYDCFVESAPQAQRIPHCAQSALGPSPRISVPGRCED